MIELLLMGVLCLIFCVCCALGIVAEFIASREAEEFVGRCEDEKNSRLEKE
jgi:hypothetical protein